MSSAQFHLRDAPALHASELLIDRPEACLYREGAALVAIRRAVIGGGQLVDAVRSIERAALGHPRGLVLLTAFRVSREYRVSTSSDVELRALVDALRALERVIAANAVVIEFDGVLASVMRATTRTVWTLARPRAAMAQFTRLSDAVTWLAPRAEAVGAPGDAATYVRLYRACAQRLEEHDCERWARGGPPPG